MEPRLVFLILVCVTVWLVYLVGYWRKKAGDAAFAAALLADKTEERDRYCRLAVMAGNSDACRMFCFAHSDFFEDRHPLKPFRFHGISVAFYGHYYPSRYKRLLSEEQREFCRSLYAFKSNWIKYGQRFKRLDWYITTHRPELTSGLYDVDVTDARESLHESKGNERILERNYDITGNIRGKRVVIIDDVFTSGQSLLDYKSEIERCGGEVVAAIFYGKTVTMPPLFLVKTHVWGEHIVRAIRNKSHAL